MNQLRDWSVPILLASLVHGAIPLIPINPGQKNNQEEDTAITFRLVSLPRNSPPPSPEQSTFLPEKKPLPPKNKNSASMASSPAKPIARTYDKSTEKIVPPQFAHINESAIPSDAAADSSADMTSSTQMPADPVMLSSELSVICPVMSMPSYPHRSRQLGEQGELTLRLELDEKGHVEKAQVINSSGYNRLDEAAISSVKTWRCNPPLLNGQPVRVIALQPFYFILRE